MKQKLRNILIFLSLISIVIGIFIVSAPFWPEAIYQSQNFGKTIGVISTEPIKVDEQGLNRLVIDKIGFNAELEEAEKANIDNALLKGPVRLKNSSTPDMGSNTVIAAHRAYYFSGPKTFYNLPKLTLGDEIKVVWNKKLFIYKVESTKEVNPDDITIESPTEESVLTLYTCTPLIDFTKRFVVKAKLIS